MTTKSRIIAKVIGIEGGYTNDVKDSGGKTRWGITKSTARSFGYKGKMKNLPQNIAIDIYNRGYWDAIKGDSIMKIGGEELVSEVFEQAVNMGVGRAGRNLQRVLNVMNNSEAYYRDLVADGAIGTRTISALSDYAHKRGDKGIKVLTSYLNAMQGAFYIELAENREKDERFVYGWGVSRVYGNA